jgi:hypothetical protein
VFPCVALSFFMIHVQLFQIHQAEDIRDARWLFGKSACHSLSIRSEANSKDQRSKSVDRNESRDQLTNINSVVSRFTIE